MNFSVKLKYIVLMCLILSSSEYAQVYQAGSLNIGTSISENSVVSAMQDSKGYLWIGTQEGLALFNGNDLRIFKNEIMEENSISDNYIHTIYEDYDGTIWVGTSKGGLNKINFRDMKFTAYRPSDILSDAYNSTKAIIEDNLGRFWIASDNNELRRFDKKSGRFTIYKLPSSYNPALVKVKDITFIYDNLICLVTYGAGILFFDTTKELFIDLDSFKGGISSQLSDSIRTVYFDRDKSELFTGTERGLEIININTWKIIKFNSKNTPVFHSDIINTIKRDDYGNLWLGTSKGIIKYLSKQNKFVNVDYHLGNPENIKREVIRSLTFDRSGVLWVGTSYYGMKNFTPNSNEYEYYKHLALNPMGAQGTLVRSIYLDSKGILWTGHNSGGAIAFDKESGKSFFYNTKNNLIYNNSVSVIKEDTLGNIWAGTWGGGLVKIARNPDGSPQNKTEIFRFDKNNPELFPDDIIMDIFPEKRNVMWIGTFSGLIRYEPETKKFISFKHNPGDNNSLSNAQVQSNCIFRDSKGYLWIGTWNGLNRMIPDKKDISKSRFERYLNATQEIGSVPYGKITSITEDGRGNLWVGTYGGGIFRINIENPSLGIVNYTEKDGLSSDMVFGMVPDSKGNIWISTAHGISKFDPVKNDFFRIFREDGLPFDKFYWGAIYKDKSGRIYMGGLEGLLSFKPETLKLRKASHKVVFTSVKIKNKRVFTENQLEYIKEIPFSHLDKFITIEFAALDFKAFNKNTYSYILEGEDKEWTFIGTRNSVNFTNLEEGNYILKIKAANSNGDWSDNIAVLKISIIPPFWKTEFFRVSIVIALLLIAYIIFKARIRYIENNNLELMNLNKELQKEIKARMETESSLIRAKKKAEESDKLKTEFLAQMSHEVRTPINSILSFLSLIKEETEGMVEDYIKESYVMVEAGSKRLTRTIDLILNMSEIQTGAYKPDFCKLDISEVINHNLSEIKPLADLKKLTLNYREMTKNRIITGDLFSVNQMVSNLIDNAVKYTDQGGVEIVLMETAEHTVIEVIDTGIGISPEYMLQLFKPFSQEDTGYSRKFEGTGLGLALVKRYAEINGAEIKVASEKNKGSVFTLLFVKTELKKES